jgi:hypothetical protein
MILGEIGLVQKPTKLVFEGENYLSALTRTRLGKPPG